MKITVFEDLDIWQEARELCNREARSQSYRAFDFGYISEEQLNCLLKRTDTLSRKIFNLMQYLKNSEIKGIKYK